jgi:hypothetical protein
MRKIFVLTLGIIFLNQISFAQDSTHQPLGPAAFITGIDEGISELVEYVDKQWRVDKDLLKRFPYRDNQNNPLTKKNESANIYLDLYMHNCGLKVKQFEKSNIVIFYSFSSENDKATTEQVNWWVSYLSKLNYKKTVVKTKVTRWTLGKIIVEIDESSRKAKEYPSVDFTVWNTL